MAVTGAHVEKEADSPPRGGWRRRAPGRIFHIQLIVPTFALLFAYSYPGVDFFIWFVSASWILASALVWAVWVVAYWTAPKRSATDPGFAIAPLAGLAVVLVVVLGLPLRIRWELSKSSFEAVAAAHPVAADTEWTRVEAPDRIGLYTIWAVDQVGGSIIFYERSGALFDYAGFAYLPDGPTDDLDTGWFEAPEFHHLGGPWYSFVASW
jgi:hypothetical protein